MPTSGKTNGAGLLPIFFSVFLIAPLNAKSDFERLFEKAKKEVNNAVKKGQLGALTDSEVIGGLKEALSLGARESAGRASQLDGFFKNASLFIPMPPELTNVEKFLNRIGLKKLSQDFVRSMNRGAEEAAKLAAPIFLKSIRKMTFNDARSILSGQENAATEFLKRTCTADLTTAFIPVVDRSLKKVDATKYWKEISTAYNSLNAFKPIQTDLNRYVTGKALDGLFHLIGEEEKKIRRDPWGQANELIRKVFSSVKS